MTGIQRQSEQYGIFKTEAFQKKTNPNHEDEDDD